MNSNQLELSHIVDAKMSPDIFPSLETVLEWCLLGFASRESMRLFAQNAKKTTTIDFNSRIYSTTKLNLWAWIESPRRG